jgi:hypothetical protein
MKKQIILIIMLFINGLAYSQIIFDRYANNENATLISISPKMFKMLGKMSIKSDFPEAQNYLEMVTSINNFKLLASSNQKIRVEILEWFDQYSLREDFNLLMSINESESKVTFYAKNAQREGHVEQLLMYATENKNTILLFLKGDIDLNKISNLIEIMNLLGGNLLKKVKP